MSNARSGWLGRIWQSIDPLYIWSAAVGFGVALIMIAISIALR